MGQGSSALGAQGDADEKKISEDQIKEALGFYRNWTMQDVNYMVKVRCLLLT